jgi:hypothetical protein
MRYSDGVDASHGYVRVLGADADPRLPDFRSKKKGLLKNAQRPDYDLFLHRR